MRLQKQVNRKVQDRKYSKYVLVVPPQEIEELGWQEGEELEPEVKGKKLIISPKQKTVA
jgi:antitoxin component of MazEF toxin-antitoxin module